MQMKFYKPLLLLVLMLSFSSIVFCQTGTLRPSRSTPVPSGPLCVMIFKNQNYTIESHLVDSLVNPKTIKSLIIEKDARATALYGSRAANGLVLIVIEDKLAEKEFKRLERFLAKF